MAINPYQSPISFASVPAKWKHLLQTAISGAGIGTLTCVLSKAVIAENVDSSVEHDRFLTTYFCFSFLPFVALWTSWRQPEKGKSGARIATALAIAFVYLTLRKYAGTLSVITFPFLWGSIPSMVFGTTNWQQFWPLARRFCKGLIPGLALGSIYTIVVSIVASLILPNPFAAVAEHSSMMWKAGTAAMACAGACYLVLFEWSAELPPDARQRPAAT